MSTAGLASICNGFGYREEDADGGLLGYVKNEYCIDNLKDLQRFLRRDDPVGRPVFRQICRWDVVSRDLVPIMEFYQNERNLVVTTVKILVFLTMPVDPTSEDIPQQIEYLWKLKAALTRNFTIAVIMGLLEEPLERLERGTFTEDDWKHVQLVLTLFRNLLAIQDVMPQHKSSATQLLYLRDGFIELLFNENVMDLILVLTQHVDDSSGYLRQDNLLLLDIFYYIFQGYEPELIATTSSRSSKAEGVSMVLNSLSSVMDEEEEKMRHINQRNLEACSKFNGTFSHHAIDGSLKLVTGNPTTLSNNILLKAHEIRRGPVKKIAWDGGSLFSPKKDVLEMLCCFLNNFLSVGYNVLMQTVHEDIEREHHAVQKSDVGTFFQVACFVTSFHRYRILNSKPPKNTGNSEDSPGHGVTASSYLGGICGPVAATMNEGVLFLVISRWREAFDDLKETRQYKFLSSSSSLVKNMIRMLDLVLKFSPVDSNEHKTARILLYKIIYDQTDHGFSQFLLNLTKSFDTHKQPKSYLVDLVEIIHVVLRLMEELQEHGSIRVFRKSRKRTKKKMQAANKGAETEKHVDINILHAGDSSCGNKKPLSQLTEYSNGSHINNILEVDGCGVELNLQDIHSVNCNEGQSLSNLVEKPNGLDKEDLTSLFCEKEACSLMPDSVQNPDMCPLEPDHVDSPSGINDKAYVDEDSSEDDHQPSTNEVDFNVSKLVSEFANSAAIRNLCWLLKFCNKNSASTNYYITCMLRRICDDLELSPMLYQLSFLTIFHDVISDPKAQRKCPNVVSFLRKLVRDMMKLMKSQPLLFVEILFWKTRKECHLINADGMMYDLHNMKRKVKELGNEGDMGFSNVFGHATRNSLADALGEDEADLIEEKHTYESSDDNPQGLMDKSNKGNAKEDNVLSMSEHVIDGEKALNRDGFKHDRLCNRVMAEALDPNGKITPLQVSSKIRQLGLKEASSRKKQDGNEPKNKENQVKIDSEEFAGDALLHNSKELEHRTELNSSLNRRKRVQAFSKEQELMIENLFKQFKSHRRCSHMIANAMDVGKTVTPAQVSRKLKQLGLITRKKRSHDDALLSGPEQSKQNFEEKPDEEIPLESITRKEKTMGKVVNLRSTAGPDPADVGLDVTDDEPLSLMLKKRRKNKMLEVEGTTLSTSKPKPAVEIPGEDKVEELPLSIMIKKRKKKRSLEGKSTTLSTSNPKPVAEIPNEDCSEELPLSVVIKDSLGQSSKLQSQIAENNSAVPEDKYSMPDNLDDDVYSNIREKLNDFGVLDANEELDDSGDDLNTDDLRKMEIRRKRKMVVDLEEDD